MVTWCDYNISLGVLSFNSPTDVCNTWCGIAPTWFAKYMVCWHVWQLLLHHMNIFSICDHPYIVMGDYTFEAVSCELEQWASDSQYIDELFWGFFGTHRPESATYSSCHDNEMVVVSWHKQFIRCWKFKKTWQIYGKYSVLRNIYVYFICLFARIFVFLLFSWFF